LEELVLRISNYIGKDKDRNVPEFKPDEIEKRGRFDLNIPR
jgi:hypothetical protein